MFRLYSQHMVQSLQMSDSLKSDGLPQSEINDDFWASSELNDDLLSNAHALLVGIVPDSLLPCK